MTSAEKLIALLGEKEYEKAYDYIKLMEKYAFGYTNSRLAFVDFFEKESLKPTEEWFKENT